MQVVATIHNGFSSKFGIPRQSGHVDAVRSRIVFQREFRNPAYVRGLEEYSHVWILWGFSENPEGMKSATVKPPRLGGNVKVGVFATRSPFRPNPIGLSCVTLERLEETEDEGVVLHVRGADLMDGTPIYDIKPYVSHADCHPEARCGFADRVEGYRLKVVLPEQWRRRIPSEHQEAVLAILEEDPRPGYHDDPERRYGFEYAGMDVRFQVRDGVATVVEVVELSSGTT